MADTLNWLEIREVTGGGIQDSFYIDLKVGDDNHACLPIRGNALHQMATAIQNPPRTVSDDPLNVATPMEIPIELPRIERVEH